MSRPYEIGARPGHPASTDVVAYVGLVLAFGVQAFAGHPAGADVVAQPAVATWERAALVEGGAPDPITATAAITEADDTLAATATLALAATAALTEADDTGSASAALALGATHAGLEADDTLAATAELVAPETPQAESAPRGAFVVSDWEARRLPVITAQVASTEADDTLSATLVLLPPRPVAAADLITAVDRAAVAALLAEVQRTARAEEEALALATLLL